MREKIQYGSVILCIVLWIIAIANKDYLVEFMIKDTFILIEYMVIPMYVSGIVALFFLYGFVRKSIIK